MADNINNGSWCLLLQRVCCIYHRCLPAEYSVGRLSHSWLTIQGERRML